MSPIERASYLAHARTRRWGQLEEATLEFLRQALQQYKAYVAYSGGKDSSVAWHLALRVDPAIPAAHFDSGGEHPETAAFVRHFAAHVGGRLQVYYPRLSYLDLLRLGWHGGAWISTDTIQHFLLHEPAQAAAEDYEAQAYIIGLRMEESRGRQMTGLRHGPIHYHQEQGMTRIAPLLRWTARDIWAYIVRYDLPYHPAYDERYPDEPIERIRVSVVVDVAAWTARETMLRLKRWHPDVYNALRRELPQVPWRE